MEKIKRERSIKERIYTLIMKNLDIESKNIIVGLSDYIL